MENGYKVLWTDNALNELEETYLYLELNWTEQVLRKLSIQLEKTLKLIARTPKSFQLSEYTRVRKVVVLKFNTLYYRIDEENKVVEILSFFSNRQNPGKRKI